MIWTHQTLGKPGNPAVIFLHGFMGCGADWREIAGPLAADFFCILPDLPGHGENTGLPFEEPLSFAVLSAGVGALLDAHGLARAVLVGYSLGGRAALHFAAAQPGRVRGLALESASPGLEGAAERAARARLDAARARRLEAVGLAAFVEEWYAAPLWASLRARPALLAKVKAGRLGEARWLAKVLAELSPGVARSLWGSLPPLKGALLLAGELDAQYAGIMYRLGAVSGWGEAQVIRRAGHNVHLEQPGSFLAALAAFLYNL
jgi:2-succinyl-6-hydroxy-2,4-cyclohexadiene-1-carboxylate synthase